MATDMNNVEIKEGDEVKVWSLLHQRDGLPEIRTVKSVGPMHSGGLDMVWFVGGGGCHHAKACEVMVGE